MEGELDALIAEAKDRVSQLISKPKMTEKLLSKPPFRFIHDTVSAITAATGFGEGLYSGEELDSAAITDKQAKLNYLDKIFNLVGICKGFALDVKALKVVQGLEPEATNKFFVTLAECASNSNIDNQEAVRRCLAGEAPGSGPVPSKRGGGAVAESKSQEPPSAQAKPQPGFKEDRKNDEPEARIPHEIEQQMIAPERGKSRGGTRGGKPNQATADTGLSGFGTMAPKLDAEIEKCDGSEAMTQQLLGTLISRPKLTEKLLGKPPFRFLHDIVVEVVKSTGFARGLYTDAELDSANVTEKNQKITFLEKIIKLVGVQLNTLVEAKPVKIVAGLDPQITNNFLQLLAVAIRHMPDSTSAVRTVLEQYGGESSSPAPAAREDAKESSAAPSRPAPVQQPVDDFKPVEDRRAQQPRQPAPTQAPSFTPEPKEPARVEERNVYPDEKIQATEGEGEGDGDSKRSARPTTARRRPPKVKDGAKEVQSKDAAPAAAKKANGIIVDGAADDDDDDAIPDETRLVDELKSESKNDDSNMANPQSKLVQDIMSRQAEQEAAVRANKTEIVDESKSNNEAAGGSGIRLGKLRKTGLDKKTGANGATTFAEGDFEKMRAAVQSLVQQTGPLGTCMDFIQEDISLMTGELHKWEEECRKYELEYEEAKRKTKETLHPLKVELADLEDQIGEHIAKISSAKAGNARNDDKIQQILKLIATA